MPSLLWNSHAAAAADGKDDDDNGTERPGRRPVVGVAVEGNYRESCGQQQQQSSGETTNSRTAGRATTTSIRMKTMPAADAGAGADNIMSASSIVAAAAVSLSPSNTSSTWHRSRHGRTRRYYDRTSTPVLDMIETATTSRTANYLCGSDPDVDDDDDQFFMSDDDAGDILDGMLDDDPSTVGFCLHQSTSPSSSSSSPGVVEICSDESSEDNNNNNNNNNSNDDEENGNDDEMYDGGKLRKHHRQKQKHRAGRATTGSLIYSSKDDEEQDTFLSSPSTARAGHVDDDQHHDSTNCELKEQHHRRRKHRHDQQEHRFKVKELDVEKYMASREMTPMQERMNAVTVMPGAFYCIMLLLSGSWLSQSTIEEEMTSILTSGTAVNSNGMDGMDDSQCLSWSWMPHLHALPPLPVLAAAIGIIFHAPFSFIYHWKFAHRLPPGLPRTTHWSRRMDQAMIHFCSMTMAYATSGRLDFFVANALFNMDCIYRQFKKKVRPRRNQARIFISIVAYTIPIVRRGDLTLFVKIWTLFGISGWLFSKYPIGGWSHSVFHIVMAFVPPLLMEAGLELPASQPQLKIAAQCAVLAQSGLAADVNVAQ